MTNKDNLQKELLEKIKPGTKPSDLKKMKPKQAQKDNLPPPIVFDKGSDEGYESDKSDKSIPTPPPPPTNQLLSLQKKIEIQEAIKKADEKIKKELQERIKTLIKLAGEEKQEYKQLVKDLQEENKNLNKTIEELKKQGKTTRESKQELFTCYHCRKQQELPLLVLELPEGKLCQPCWTILRKKTKENVKPKPTLTNFTCHNCHETKKQKEYKVKLDATLTEYSTCSTCLPLIKEYNEKEKDSDRELEEWE